MIVKEFQESPIRMAGEILRHRKALREIMALIEDFPGGCDEEADPNNTSPENNVQHQVGLMRQACKRGLEPRRA